MGGLPINRKNVVANDFDDPEIEQEENVRDFIAELKERLEEKTAGPKMTGTPSQKEKEKMEKMLRQQRIREAVRSGSRKSRWDEDDPIKKLREKFKNRK